MLRKHDILSNFIISEVFMSEEKKVLCNDYNCLTGCHVNSNLNYVKYEIKFLKEFLQREMKWCYN